MPTELVTIGGDDYPSLRLAITTPSESEVRRIVSSIANRPLPFMGFGEFPRPAGTLEASIQQVIRPVCDRLERLIAKVESLEQTVDDLVPSTDRLWSYSQVATKCLVSPATVRSWVHLDKIKTVSVHGKRRVPDSEVKRLILNANRP